MEELFQLLLILAILGFPLIKGLMKIIAGFAGPKDEMQQVEAREDASENLLIVQRSETPAKSPVKTTQAARKNRPEKLMNSSSISINQQSVPTTQPALESNATPVMQPALQSEHPIISLFRDPATVQQIVLAAEILKRPDFGNFGKEERSLEHTAF